MWSRTWTLWPRSTYVTCATLYTTQTCDKACSLCTSTPPCFKDQTIVVHATGGSWVRYFISSLTLKVNDKLVCQWRQVCRNCSFTGTRDSKHECWKRFCNYCIPKQHSGHFATMLHWSLASWQNCFWMFFWYGEHTRPWKHNGTFEHIPSLVLSRCVQIAKQWMTWMLI